ncbi:MAG: hypothetical protein NC548_31530 [Lachnospiraceae bacterium]|nr:hypothetical protein [Lachnospiraceae bacterium]
MLKRKKKKQGIYNSRVTVWMTRRDKSYLAKLSTELDLPMSALVRDALNAAYPGYFENNE